MTETPEQRVARLEAELAQAKVTALQAQLGQARAQAGYPGGATSAPAVDPGALVQQSGSRGDVRFTKRAADPGLAMAPRPVPAAYRMVAIPFSWWTLFALFMIAVAPIALWIALPLAGVVAGLVTFVIVVVTLLRRSALRHTLLKWGNVAEVVGVDTLSQGTYYSGTTVQNVRMAQAHGWDVERRWYSGPVTKTRVDYVLGGTRASLVIRGLEYADGIILADSRDPRHALCVSSFPYALDRDPAGNWIGQVATRTKLASSLMVVALLGWTAGMCWVWGVVAGGFGG